MDRRGGHGGGAWGARQWIGWALAWVVTAADKAVATREVLALAERRCGWWLRRLATAV